MPLTPLPPPNPLPLPVSSSAPLPSAKPKTPCPHCHNEFTRLASHRCKQKPQQTSAAGPPAATPSVLLDLADLKSSRIVIKWIPEGARETAANIFIRLLRDCLKANVSNAWRRLFCFAYVGLFLPDPTAKKEPSLTAFVKKNLDEAGRDLSDVVIASLRKFTRKSPKIPDDFRLRKAVEGKIQEGNISGAVRLLSSNDSVAACTAETLAIMKEKHPSSGSSTVLPAPPAVAHVIPPVTPEELMRAVFSFPNGSAGGLDGLKPQHLKDILGRRDNHDSSACGSMRNFIDAVISGELPDEQCSVFYGASLTALKKKDGGYRPIAVGNVLRRTAAKIVASRVQADMGRYLRPKQLGFGSKGGAEAVVHAARGFVSSKPTTPKLLLKLDYKNAFNSVHRTTILQVVDEHLPMHRKFFMQSYSSTSSLLFDKEEILSRRGVQQGDPLGPLVFCLCIHPVTLSLTSEFVAFYLDDGTIGGDIEAVLQDLDCVRKSSEKIGLELNLSKCEVFVFGGNTDERNTCLKRIAREAPELKVVQECGLELLGVPLFDAGICDAVERHITALERMCSRLSVISAHQGFYLLRHCFALPKLLYTLRCAPCWKYPDKLKAFDEVVRGAVRTITNVEMNNRVWDEAVLPVKRGGLGLRRAESLSLPAFLASVCSVRSLILVLFPEYGQSPLEDAAVDLWKQDVECDVPSEAACVFQKSWDEPGLKKLEDRVALAAETDDRCKARILAVRGGDSGQWLNALPTPVHGNLLNDQEFRIAVALRLGAKVVEEHDCENGGAKVEENGYHGLSCRKNRGWHPRHSGLNELIRRKFVAAGVDAVLEPGGLDPTSSLRPDGKTRVMWKDGKAAIWDVTVTDTMSTTNVPTTRNIRGSGAAKRELEKNAKYQCLFDRFVFYPLACESFGVWGESAIELFVEIGRRLRLKNGDKRCFGFLMQNLSVELQRGNAVCVLGTLDSGF